MGMRNAHLVGHDKARWRREEAMRHELTPLHPRHDIHKRQQEQTCPCRREHHEQQKFACSKVQGTIEGAVDAGREADSGFHDADGESTVVWPVGDVRGDGDGVKEGIGVAKNKGSGEEGGVGEVEQTSGGTPHKAHAAKALKDSDDEADPAGRNVGHVHAGAMLSASGSRDLYW
jgi:hypothetical protein